MRLPARWSRTMSPGSAGSDSGVSFSFLVWAIYKKGKEVTKKEKIKNIKRIKASEIYYNNYGELP